jgi:arginyl-tRNA synthetase
VSDPLSELRATIDAAIGELADGALAERPTLERPPRAEMGDYSTNAAMLLAPVVGDSPRAIAERLGTAVRERLGDALRELEVAGPGFLNLHLTDRWHREAVAAIVAAGDDYGRGTPEAPERILVEYVSANPTGPLTVAGARGAAYGDSLARLLEASGYHVGREYFLNDVGGQVDRFAASIAARMRGHEPPEDGYGGEYVGELAAELEADGYGPDDLGALGREGTERMRRRIAATLERFGVTFDVWFSERTLHEAGAIDATVGELREAGHIYDSEGAVWLRTTVFGDDKDRVLIRADGQPTYFAADIAYHRDKLDRGWERMIDPLGADHHGYIPRMRASLEALRGTGDRYEAPIMQLVQIVEGGERARMSKRAGEFVTLDDLLDDIGVDAARFFMLQRSHDTAIDLDLDLARRQSQDNPVYYVQYAHARIASILRRAEAEGRDLSSASLGGADDALDVAAEGSERVLIRRLLELPAQVSEAAERRAPHRLCSYAMATAADFHAFYRDCQVLGTEAATENARLGICIGVQRIIGTSLALLGISAPERM